MNKTVFEEGIEKGIEKGLERGAASERMAAVVLLLETRIGPVSQALREHIETRPMDELAKLMVRIAKANTLADAGLGQFAN